MGLEGCTANLLTLEVELQQKAASRRGKGNGRGFVRLK